MALSSYRMQAWWRLW